MAPSKARAFEFDVFLSFSGADTRFDFTDFLSRDLNNAGIRVFRDEDAIEVGDKIGQTILQAIDNSKIYVPIISQTYPDSEWCLIELEHMMYNVFRSNAKKKIFPIFYKVEPAHVKHRTPRPKNLSSEEALVKVGQIKGWKVEEGQSQAKIVDLVVRKVLEELGRKDESQTEHSIELDDLTQSLEDSYNHAVMRYAGRESLSRGSIGRGTSLSSTSTERRWSNLSINRIEGMDMEEARVSTGRSGSKGSLSMNRMEDMYMEEGSGSTGGEVEAAEVEGAVEAAEGLAAAEEGGVGAVEAAGNSSGEEEVGEAVRGSFQDIFWGRSWCAFFMHCVLAFLFLKTRKQVGKQMGYGCFFHFLISMGW
ncbi:disease resistance protein RPP4-like [Eucalyptus grandis]|uniref:disease resistance protein RPP4-like n=1 Tax=Eucalyptus grandis TaxID=71139 RepID=UPI00192EBB50|nr:disease resistance protein RPP4-like [Eucalyptus grandis]